MKPSKSILDPSFRYTNAAQTDIAKTFARIRREQKAEADARTVKMPLVFDPRRRKA